jgi:flagellar biosynthesis/type III secretory pathway ATPase
VPSKADPETLNTLPATWASESDVSAHPMEAKRYAELVSRLQGLASAKAEISARVQRLRRMQETLAPFEAGSGVQENLVTRNGELELELERTRMLLARVSGRVAQLKDRGPETTGGHDRAHVLPMDDAEAAERKKVDDVLGML